MNKADTIKAIKAYQKLYTDTVAKIERIRASDPYTEETKVQMINTVVERFNAQAEEYRAKATEAVTAIQNGISEKRQADIAKGLEAADTVNSIVSGIQNGVYSTEMLRDIVSVNAGNPYAMKTIRGALAASDNDGYKSIGLEIPLSNDERISKNLDRIISDLSDVPSPAAIEDGKGNFATGFFQNGTTFSNWCDYIDSNIIED